MWGIAFTSSDAYSNPGLLTPKALPHWCNTKGMSLHCKGLSASASTAPSWWTIAHTRWPKLPVLSRMLQNTRDFMDTLLTDQFCSISTLVFWMLLWKTDLGFHQMKGNQVITRIQPTLFFQSDTVLWQSQGKEVLRDSSGVKGAEKLQRELHIGLAHKLD